MDGIFPLKTAMLSPAVLIHCLEMVFDEDKLNGQAKLVLFFTSDDGCKDLYRLNLEVLRFSWLKSLRQSFCLVCFTASVGRCAF